MPTAADYEINRSGSGWTAGLLAAVWAVGAIVAGVAIAATTKQELR